MEHTVRRVYTLIAELRPLDELEAEHQGDALQWLENCDDIFRRSAPMTPPKHLVSYFLPVDLVDSSVLLVDHIKAGRWLPPGGHVEAGEDPVDTVRREAREELAVDAVFAPHYGERPCFLTTTDTRQPENRHTDVSLWFVLQGKRAERLSPDAREFHRIRWWSPEEIRDADPEIFDPHFGRMLTKIGILPNRA